MGILDQLVGLPAHGRDDDDDVVPLVTGFGHPFGDVGDAVEVTDAGSAVFLHDQHVRGILFF